MGSRLTVAALLLVAATLAAKVLDRRRGRTAQLGGYEVPTWLDRRDFPGTGTPWLVVLFSSRTCASCFEVSKRIGALSRPGEVHTSEVEADARADLHRRYAIEAVPLVAIADAEGSVRAGFLGLPRPGELEEALERLRAEEQDQPFG
ncbi:MAG: hypothetical protein ACRDV9_00990 [Acidimicrobiia bacterium]